MTVKTGSKESPKKVSPLTLRVSQSGIKEVAELVWHEMQTQNLSFADVAEKARCSDTTVRKLVNEEHVNHRAIWIGTLIGILNAVGYSVTAKGGN